jgi:hypothetical protein
MATWVVDQAEKANYLESYILIWLDNELTSDQKKQGILERLRSTINYQKVYDDVDQCRQFITTVRIARLVIISDDVLGERLISSLDDWQNISALYIQYKDIVPEKGQPPSNEKVSKNSIRCDSAE